MTASPALAALLNLDDVRTAARRRLPRVLFDFIDGGAGGEWTVRANRDAFGRITFRPRQATATGRPDLRTRVLGRGVAAPLLIAPCGSARLAHPLGEIALARAAAAAGLGYVMPQMGGHDLLAVREAAPDALLWFQTYRVGGPDVAGPAIERARAAGYAALVVNIENGAATRERDLRNGLGALMSGDLGRALPHLPQLLGRPAWLAGFMADGRPTHFPNALRPDGAAMRVADVIAANAGPGATYTWADFVWLRALWPGPIVAKGVLTPDDARRAVDHGCAGVIVSNHGGRGVDGLPASLSALPPIVRAVGEDAEVYLDGGVRRGGDIARAVALGARAVLVGRPSMFGLSLGEAGVRRMLDLLTDELARTLAGLGCPAIDRFDEDFISSPWNTRHDAAR